MNDRQLLFGVLALQADFLNAAQFAEACSAWATNKETTLSSILLERGWMTSDDVKLVEMLLEKKLAKHAGNVQVTLAYEVPSAVRQEVVNNLDAAVAATLNWQGDQHGREVLLSTTGVPGTRDRYSTTRLHAAGGLGRVWLARDTGMDREVALKEILPERAGLSQATERFIREARITGQLEHPGIVPVYELVTDAPAPFYTMRFIRGRTLSIAIADYHRRKQDGTSGVLEFRELLQAFVLLCQAVAYAHSRRVIHRDLKPDNVVLGDFGEVILLDWGIAKVMGEPESNDPESTALFTPPVKNPDGTDATQAGTILGTPQYMAPEQASGAVSLISEQTDIYGLGVILYEILVGKVPFQDSNLTKLLMHVIHDAPPRPKHQDHTIPASIEAVCLKCLKKSQNERYQSARELADEVKQYLADEPVKAYRDPLRVRMGRWAKRHRTQVAVLTTLVLVAIPVLLVSLVLVTNAADRERDARGKEQEAREQAEQNFDRAVRAAELVSDELARGIKPIAGTQSKTVIEICARAEAVYDELLSLPNPPIQAKLNKAKMLCLMSEVYHSANRIRSASESARQAIVILDQILEGDPQQRGARLILGMVYNRYGRAIFDMADNVQALELFNRSIQTFDEIQLSLDDPAEMNHALASSLTIKGNLLMEYRDYAAAKLSYERGLKIREALFARNPTTTNANQLALSLEKLGSYEIKMRQFDTGIVKQRRAVELNQSAFHADPLNHESGQHLIRVITTYAMNNIDEDRNESKKLLEQARDLSATFARRDPDNNDWEREALRANWTLGELDKKNWIRLPPEQRQPAKDKQLQLLLNMLRVADKRHKQSPENFLWLTDCVNIRSRVILARMEYDEKFAQKPELQKQVLEEIALCMKESEMILKFDPKNYQARMDTNYVQYLRSRIQLTIGKSDEALRLSVIYHAEAYRIYRDLSAAYPDDDVIRLECLRGMKATTVDSLFEENWHALVKDEATIEAILDFAADVSKPNPRLALAVEKHVTQLRENILSDLKKLDEIRPLPPRGKAIIEQMSAKLSAK